MSPEQCKQVFPRGGRLVRWRELLLFCSYAFLFILLLVSLGSCTKPAKVHRVGILSGLDYFATTADGFKIRMTELGYVEGKNITYDFQRTNFEPSREMEILEAFVRDSIDLILAFPTEVSVLAKAVSDKHGIPLVFANANVEGVDLVKDLRAPGGDVTGVRFPGPDIAVRRLEILHDLVPGAREILVPFERDYPIVGTQLDAMAPAAKAMGMHLIPLPAVDAGDLETKLRVLDRQKKHVDAVLMIPEPLMVSPAGIRPFERFAHARAIPVGGAAITVDGFSTLFGVSTHHVAVGRQAADLADKILKGIRAGSIPVASAETFVQINTTAARAMKVTIPPAMLKQADEIIK